MAINEFEFREYLEEARERATDQFVDKPVFNKYLELLLSSSMELQEVFMQLMQERSLDTAIGKQLDLLGELVGQPRELIDADLITFFGFMGDFHADSYGTLHNPDVGSVWWDGSAPNKGNILLNDDLYRILIKAKILKNVTRATPEDMMQFANFVFSTGGSTVTDEGEASFTLMVGKELTRTEVGFLQWLNETDYYVARLFPKPIGVRMDYSSFDYNSFFAFEGIPNAKGYGSVSYKGRFDGEHIYDGSFIPGVMEDVDENGNPLGGKWATFHETLRY